MPCLDDFALHLASQSVALLVQDWAMAVKKIPSFPLDFTRNVCDVLAQTDWPGLTGSQIEHLLQEVRVNEFADGSNKRERLTITLNNVQTRQGCGNVLTAFIAKAMSPARHHADPIRLEDLRSQLNEVLAYQGLRVQTDGKLANAPKASTYEDVVELVGRLQTELKRRGTHPVVLEFCREELITQSLFHAVSEAAKSLPERIRRITGRTEDGAELYNAVLGASSGPKLQINPYATKSDISEHSGFLNLLTAVHGIARNPRAHRTRLGSPEERQQFFDYFAVISMAHRYLDDADTQ